MLRPTIYAALLGFCTTAVADFNGDIDPVVAFDWVNMYEDVVLLDVRTPEEWRWVGVPGPNGLADSKGKGKAYNNGAGLIAGENVFFISYRIASVEDGDAGATSFIYGSGLPLNPDFEADVLEQFGDPLDGSTPTLLLACRSGSRATAAAEALGALGYDTWNIEGGFEGTKNTDEYPGPDTGYRDVNGWRNAGLPWNQDPVAAAKKVLLVEPQSP